MRRSRARVAGGAVVAAITTVVTALEVVPASAQPATPSQKDPGVGSSTVVSCGVSYATEDFSGFHSFPTNTVTLRSGPSNSCIQTGQGTHDQLAQYLCYTPCDGGPGRFCAMLPRVSRAGFTMTCWLVMVARCPAKKTRHLRLSTRSEADTAGEPTGRCAQR
jgi:hypothetical protein